MKNVSGIVNYVTSDNTIKWLRLASLFIGVFAETKWYIQKKFDLRLIIAIIVIAFFMGYSGKL